MHRIIKFLGKEKFKYLLNGLVLNLLSYLFYLIFTYFGFQPISAVIIVMPIMNLLNFYIQKIIVFKSSVDNKKGIFFFLILFIQIYILNIFFLYVATELFLFNHVYSQLIIILCLAIYSYYFSKLVVFR